MGKICGLCLQLSCKKAQEAFNIRSIKLYCLIQLMKYIIIEVIIKSTKTRNVSLGGMLLNHFSWRNDALKHGRGKQMVFSLNQTPRFSQSQCPLHVFTKFTPYLESILTVRHRMISKG